jgi:hypothetical protein
MPHTLDHRNQMAHEHAAWLDVCQELLDVGIDINTHGRLASALSKWGEELHHLRLTDPQYDMKALTEKREAYEGQFERGTYPEELRRQ